MTRKHTNRHALGRIALTITGLLALSLLAGAGWGTFHLMQPKAKAKEKPGKIQWYQAPMEPWIISPHPGKSPMGMQMIPLDPKKFASEIAVDPVTAQNIGVRTTKAKYGPLVQTLRTVGQVDYDETQLFDVNTKIAGWIENLHIDSVGQDVHKGEPLFDLYSPQLYAAQEEFLVAIDGLKQAKKNRAANSVVSQSQMLLDAARTKLQYFDITTAQINALAKRHEAKRVMTIYSPFTGIVVKKGAFEGKHITPGTLVYRIADLSKVWVIASVYESQLPLVHKGQMAAMSLSYLPGETFKGHVDYVYPYLNDKAREAKVRLVFSNPHDELKPGMFANVRLKQTAAPMATLVPRSAVIDTGERKVLFVSKGHGHFEPRHVTLGMTTDNGWIQILKGVKPGESVVTSGEFLLDSESRMREALAKMMGSGLVKGKKPAMKMKMPMKNSASMNMKTSAKARHTAEGDMAGMKGGAK